MIKLEPFKPSDFDTFIRCYEKTGFAFNPEKKFSTKTGDIEWVALNMTIDKNKWINWQKQTA